MISEVAQRYARALYDLAHEHKNVERVFGEVKALSQALQQEPSLLEFLNSALVPVEDKILSMKRGFENKLSAEVLNFCYVLSEKSRWALFAEISEALQKLNDDLHKITRGQVRSAAPLSAAQQKAIEETVRKTLGKQVLLSFSEDANLLGGTVAQVGGWTFDDSIESHLTRLNETLRKHGGEPWKH